MSKANNLKQKKKPRGRKLKSLMKSSSEWDLKCFPDSMDHGDFNILNAMMFLLSPTECAVFFRVYFFRTPVIDVEKELNLKRYDARRYYHKGFMKLLNSGVTLH